MAQLLTRDQFRTAVFERDGYKCVMCGAQVGHQNHEGGHPGRLDAHHIIERRLWTDGGYYLDNGATLCDFGFHGCHLSAETTEISVEDIRHAAGITNIVLPEDMYSDHIYDKWGNIVLANGQRTKGPLFNDLSVRKVLSFPFPGHPNGALELFTDYVKYPRTYHLPWSPGITEDDRVMKDISCFEGKRVIITEKMDGENFSGYRDYCHARSVDGRSHYTRNWAKTFWAQRSYELPEGWRICAENLYAVHSIRYHGLPGYLMGFSVWNEKNECLSWDDTVEWFQLLDMPTVPVLWDGMWDYDFVRNAGLKMDARVQEGYVIRIADSFTYGAFNRSVAKVVRRNHVQTQKHWFYGKNDHDTNFLAVGG